MSEIGKLARRASRLHVSASDIFNDVGALCPELKDLAADTMCSAAELAGRLRARSALNQGADDGQ